MNMTEFISRHYHHFNAATLKDATESYKSHLKNGGKMFLTLAGAMSTAELGISLAEMIRKDKVHAICCTGANLEEDIFNLVAHNEYERVPQYRYLTKSDEVALRDRAMNRVTDTCIPEENAMRRIERAVLSVWQRADRAGERYFPYEYMYQVIRENLVREHYQIDEQHSWLIAACEKNLPIFVPGWEDSTLGNMFVANVIKKELSGYHVVKSGLETMAFLIDWYRMASRSSSVGFFQIGGGIAGDFPICVVPLMNQDLKEAAPYWGYFCQISDSTTSYGSYSGAVPNEKITWGKIDETTPQFVIESDATIVAPLMFASILEE
ncbi:MAG: deoxyhypusine synthase family protein [Patescibacteria group bacterium]